MDDTPSLIPPDRQQYIQSFGFLLSMSADWVVARASANLESFLGIAPAAAIGVRLDALIDVITLHELRNRMASLHRPRGIERLYKKTLTAGRAPFDIAVHYSESLIILEGELSRLADEVDAASLVRSMMTRAAPRTTLEAFYRDAARKIRGATGFLRVMIYRFADNGAGEVLAESLAVGMESFLGLHYPAADIPVPTRALYLRNPLSFIADVGASPVALLPGTASGSQPLDLSLAMTRAVSPLHLEHLKKTGIGASLSISIIIGEKLWGVIACYHNTPRLPDAARRAAGELYGQLFSLTLESWLKQTKSEADEERRKAFERQEVLIAELNHRVRNILSLIRGLISQTDRSQGDVSSYVQSLNGRIQAIARAHDQITRQNWGPGKLSALLDGEISAYIPERKDRFTLIGPAVALQPPAFSTLSLVIHELVTNSVKYGSLSDGGRVVVTLDHQPDAGLTLKWQEVDGPRVEPPQHRGFGSVIIERVVPFDLQGTAQIRYAPTGLEADFFIPEFHIATAAVDDPAEIPGSQPDGRFDEEPLQDMPLSGCDVLLLEDNMIIALEAEDLLRELGAAAVYTASTVAGAEQILEAERIDWALLDINLGVSTSLGLAETLRDAGIPFIFASGYDGNMALGEVHRTSLTVTKPFSRRALGRAIIQCKGRKKPFFAKDTLGVAR